MKFNKNIALFILMLVPVCSQASSPEDIQKLLAAGQAQAQEILGDAGKKVKKTAEQFTEDSGNMFADYKATIFGMKNPMIQTTYATLKMQPKKHPRAAKEFVTKAVSPYYTAGFISFIAGTSLLATSIFSSDKKTLWAGSALCFTTSLGCYYKSRSDIIALRKTITAASLIEAGVSCVAVEDQAHQKNLIVKLTQKSDLNK